MIWIYIKKHTLEVQKLYARVGCHFALQVCDETLLKGVIRQMPFMCFVRYMYPRNMFQLIITLPLSGDSDEDICLVWDQECGRA
jgi:hypothetical protein